LFERGAALLGLWIASHQYPPLRRARSLERLLDTPARIFYKDESVGPTGSFKPNEAVAEAFYSREAGAKKIITLTGAAQ
jgi:tryptophan synthase beta chain